MARAKVSRRIVAQTIARKLIYEPQRKQEWLAMGAAYLIESKQADKAEQLVQDIVREIQAQSGVLLASVTSAYALTVETQNSIAASLAVKTGATEVKLDTSIEPELLSGYVARTPDYEVNTTAQYRLRQLKSLEA